MSVYEYSDSLIRRPISLGLFLTRERANYKVYKTAQNSPIYTKVGRGGTNLLDESARRFRARLDREEKAYREAVDRLCAFEEGFDFVIHALAGRSVDKSKMREELAGLKSYMDDTTACVGGMQATGDDIVRRSSISYFFVLMAGLIGDESSRSYQTRPSCGRRREGGCRITDASEKSGSGYRRASPRSERKVTGTMWRTLKPTRQCGSQ